MRRDVLRDKAGDALEGLPPTGEQDDDIARLSGELDGLKRSLGQVVEHIRGTASPPPRPESVPAPAPGGAPNKDDLTKQFYKDPLTASAQISSAVVQDQLSKALAPYHQTAVVAARATARGSGVNAEIFDALEVQIEATMQTMPQQGHAMVSVWQNAFDLAKGKNLDKVMEITNKYKKPASSRSFSDDGPSAPSHNAPPARKEEALSEDERAVMVGMGLTESQYRKGKEYAGNSSALFDDFLTKKGRRDTSKPKA